jgi:phage gp46-like protein
MGNINLETKDYVLMSLDSAFNDDVVQSACLRLNIHRYRYWADPDLGSRFYTLRRSKDVPRMLQIVKQYAEEAHLLNVATCRNDYQDQDQPNSGNDGYSNADTQTEPHHH